MEGQPPVVGEPREIADEMDDITYTKPQSPHQAQNQVSEILISDSLAGRDCPRLVSPNTWEPAPSNLQNTATTAALPARTFTLEHEMREEIDRLRRDLEQAHSDKMSLQEMLQKLESDCKILNDFAGDKDQALKNLRRTMLREGRKDEAPMDDEISIKFYKLRDMIFQLVKRHFQTYSESKKLCHPGASPDLQELRLRSEIANYLYDSFFSPELMIFVLEGEIEECFQEFETSIRNCRTSKWLFPIASVSSVELTRRS